LSFITIIC